ncbi:MAG: T9SS type A sorting domain-containing protein [Bacteroidota bacterium]
MKPFHSIALALVLSAFTDRALAGSQGPSNGYTHGTIAYGSQSWSGHTNTTWSDNSYATVSVDDGQHAAYLTLSNFGFAVPNGSTVQGIEVMIERRGEGGNIKDKSVRLLKGGVLAGSDLADGSSWTSNDNAQYYGGSTNLWGTTWTASDLSSSSFGLALSVQKSSSGGGPKIAYIDQMRITIYYASPLPISLLNFSVKPLSHSVVITWETVSEINNDYFTVERSSNGAHFEELETVTGAGNSTTVKNYELIDEQPIVGTSYYRLKQTDYDGKISYSHIVSANIQLPVFSVSIHPNPTCGKFTISATDKMSAVRIYNSLGMLIYHAAGCSSEITVDLTGENNGLVFIQVFYESAAKTCTAVLSRTDD